NASSHTGLSLGSPGARVVLLLIADLTINLEHTFVSGQHVINDRTGKGVLRIGINVHLDDTVIECLADLLKSRTRTAVEHEVEEVVLASFGRDCILDLFEYRWLELDVTWLIDTMNIAERGSHRIAASVTRSQVLDRVQAILWSRVKLCISLSLD